MEVPIPPSRVITAISVVFLLRFLGTFPQALFPLGALTLRRVMEVLKPLSSTNTRCPASKREASHPPQTSRLLVTLGCYLGLFGRPPTVGQGGYRSPNGGGGDPLSELLLESLAVLFEGKVVVGLQVLWQPASEHRPLPGGSAGARLGLYIPGLPTSLHPALYGGHRHREGLCDLLPGHCALDGG